MKNIVIIFLLILISSGFAQKKCLDFIVKNDTTIVCENDPGHIFGKIISFKCYSKDFDSLRTTNIDTSFVGVFAVSEKNSVKSLGAVFFYNKENTFQLMSIQNKLLNERFVLVGKDLPAGATLTICYTPIYVKKAGGQQW